MGALPRFCVLCSTVTAIKDQREEPEATCNLKVRDRVPLQCHYTGFAVVLFDDAIVLTRQQPTVKAFQGFSVLPYLFGVAVYAFEVRPPLTYIPPTL